LRPCRDCGGAAGSAGRDPVISTGSIHAFELPKWHVTYEGPPHRRAALVWLAGTRLNECLQAKPVPRAHF